MSKRKHQEYTDRLELTDAGWDVHKRDAVAFNGGSESLRHAAAKLLVARELRERGYRIDTEVHKGGAGEIDVIAYGTDEPPVAVEVETDPKEDVIQDKLERYYEGEPFRDVFVLDPTEMPEQLQAAAAWVKEEL